MKFLNKRFLFGPTLDSLIKDYYKDYHHKQTREEYYCKFFTDKERSILNEVYMTTYENTKGKFYVIFTNHLPSPGGKIYRNTNDIIGATTGYNTKVVSCEKCYIIG